MRDCKGCTPIATPTMPVRKLFWDDPCRTTLDTVVASVAGPVVELEATIFFAFSGGQESDRGTIGGHEVLVAEKAGMAIRYTLPESHGLIPGQPVTVAIDWPRRHRLMRLHFAAELVLELMYRRVPGIDKIGAHIGQGRARIDFAHAGSVAPLLPELAADANAIVAADRRIETGYEDEPGERRYWMIEGFSRVPCGGTHVRSTGEVGTIALKRKNVGSGKERIEIVVA